MFNVSFMFFYYSSDQWGSAEEVEEQYSCEAVWEYVFEPRNGSLGSRYFFFFLWPARFIKLCIIYYRDLTSPIIVFLTVIFHESLDKNCFSIDLVAHRVCSLPLQAAEMEQGMRKWFKILILYMFYKCRTTTNSTSNQL